MRLKEFSGMGIRFSVIVALSVFSMICFTSCHDETVSGDKINGPLQVSSVNPRYFEDADGNIVYLTGSHTWSNLVDTWNSDPPVLFDFTAYLNWLKKYNHNFIRLWTWELFKEIPEDDSPDKTNSIYPQPWKRTGPGIAPDGKPKFNLEEFNEDYFDRLRTRVDSAQSRGMYVSVMLFEGWGMQFAVDAWKNHPFHPDNNVNAVNADLDGDGKGLEIHTLAIPEITAIQENYVRKVIDVINGFDNVLYEISNENHPPSTQWQYHMINCIHEYEETKPFRHPVGMTFQYRGGSNDTLFASPAEWISPNAYSGGKNLRDDPPAAKGEKVILYDTDHLWGIGGNVQWVWKTFTMGMNPIFMDPYDQPYTGRNEVAFDPIRKNMGYTRIYADKMDLSRAVPHYTLASTKYCLAAPGQEYLVYQPVPDSSFTVALEKGKYRYEWFNTASGLVEKNGKVKARTGSILFKAPFNGDAVLFLKRY